MARLFTTTIATVLATIQPNWSVQMSANSRNVMRGAVLSLDGSNRPASGQELLHLEGVTIISSSVANPTVFTTAEPHGIVTGQTVTISGHTGSTPAISSIYVATRISATQFSIPVNVTVGGSGGGAYRRIFGGIIDTTGEAGLGGYGVRPIVTEITGADFAAPMDGIIINEVFAAGTLKSMLLTLAGGHGMAVHPDQVDGPAVAEQTFTGATATEVMNSLSATTEYVWEKDEYDFLRMFLPTSVTAPFNVVDGDGTAIGDITVEPARTNFSNGEVIPTKVRYVTEKIGARPGHTQTITIADRNLNNLFMIIDVGIQHVNGQLVRSSITAVESSVVQEAARWQDKYKQWAGGGSSVPSPGAGSGTVIPPPYDFGGSQTEWQQTTSGAWIAANSIQKRIDTGVRGLTGICYVRLRARSGSVTARFRNVSDNVTCGTSSAITNTTFEWTTIAVTLTAGAKFYAIELSPSVSNEDIQMGSGYFE